MVLIIICSLIVFSLLILMRSYGVISEKERELDEAKEQIEKADDRIEELELLKRYYQNLESAHNLGTITESEYEEEQAYLYRKVDALEKALGREEANEER